MNISIKEETLGQRIRLGMTQEELSKLLEINPNYLLGAIEYNADVLDILGVLKKMAPSLKKVVLEQIKELALL